MRFPYLWFLVLVAAGCVISAGCTQTAAPQAPATSAPGPVPDLAGLALAPGDLPSCYTMTSANTKSRNEVGQLARDIGWQAGYEAVYSCDSGDGKPTTLVHTLAVYPAANIPGIADMVYRQDRVDGYTYENLSDPGARVFIGGYYGKADPASQSGDSEYVIVVNESGQAELRPASADQPADFAEFIIYRGSVFSVLKMTGPGTDAAFLHGVARSVAGRLP